MEFKIPVAITLVFAAGFINPVYSHGRLMNPPMRNSVWRFPELAKYNPPFDYTDNELNCGGFGVQYSAAIKGKCGPCGDAFSDPTPRKSENGGTYGRGIITRKYKPGEKIPIAVQLTRSHLGYFEFHLCPNPGVPESDSCFKYTLQLADGSGTKYYIKTGDLGYFNTSIVLPASVTCNQCVLRWHYRAGNSWGDCGNGVGGMGCGDQETFRGCADISITGSPVQTKPNPPAFAPDGTVDDSAPPLYILDEP